mgnify:CR=1 FL=1
MSASDKKMKLITKFVKSLNPKQLNTLYEIVDYEYLCKYESKEATVIIALSELIDD